MTIVLGHIEETKIFQENNIYPTVYLRYVDDIFAVFENGTSYLPFFNLLNQQHPNLKFTVEEQTGVSFPFLNVSISINGNSVDTWVFRKKTHTGVMLNYNAVVPNCWKNGLIRCLLHSAKKICSSEHLFNGEVENLRKLFAANGYPGVYFDSALQKFLSSLEAVNTAPDDREKPERKYIFGIPYVGKASKEYKQKITELLKENLQVDISTYYNSTKISSLFSLKSKVPFALKARVVYKFSCLSDSDTSYIGKSKRHLVIRAREHINPKESNQSEIKNHIFDCNTCKTHCLSGNLSVKNFTILKQCRDDYAARISEALLIKQLEPKLNRQKFTKGQSYLLRVF